MGSQRRTEPSEILQLGGAAAVCAAMWTTIYVTWLSPRLDLVPAIGIGVIAAGVGALLQLLDWELLGGRSTVAMTDKWIRNRAIPPTISREIWAPLLRKREARASRQWRSLIVVALQIPLAIVQLFDATHSDHVFWTIALVFWVGLAAWVLYFNFRWLPVIRRLLRDERTPVALCPTMSGNSPADGAVQEAVKLATLTNTGEK